MNEIVVGVKRIANGVAVDPDEEAFLALGAMWLTIDGKEFPTDGTQGMISVGLEASASPLEVVAQARKPNHRRGDDDEVFGGPVVVSVRVACSSFRTVDYRDPAFAPERFTEKVEEAKA